MIRDGKDRPEKADQRIFFFLLWTEKCGEVKGSDMIRSER